jgi:hypothetical protein
MNRRGGESLCRDESTAAEHFVVWMGSKNESDCRRRHGVIVCPETQCDAHGVPHDDAHHVFDRDCR